MALDIVIIGAGDVGQSLGIRLQTRGHQVTLVEQDEQAASDAQQIGLPVVVGDATNLEILHSAGVAGADVLAATTGSDDVNLLATQLASTQFDVERPIARVNEPTNVGAFRETGVRPVSTSEATAEMLDNYIERPSITNWIDELSFGGDAQEVKIENPALDGWSIGDLDELLPEQVILVMVTHEDTTEFPDPETTIELGDRVTLLGERQAVREAVDRLTEG